MELTLIQRSRYRRGLREGENKLSIIPPREMMTSCGVKSSRSASGGNRDGGTTLEVRVTEQQRRRALAESCHESSGALAALIAMTIRLLQSAAGRCGTLWAVRLALFTRAMQGALGLRREATPYASRGLSTGVARKRFTSRSRREDGVAVSHTRSADARLVSCERTQPHDSKHGDATTRTNADAGGEGIEFPSRPITTCTSIRGTARRMNVAPFFTPVCGNESDDARGAFHFSPSSRAPSLLIPHHGLAAARRSDAFNARLRVVILNPPQCSQQFSAFAHELQRCYWREQTRAGIHVRRDGSVELLRATV